MKEERIQEIIREAENAYDRFVSSIIEISGFTLDNLPDDRMKDFVYGGFCEFTEYRQGFGARLIFQCLKNPEGYLLFLERFRIYSKESPKGIERGNAPTYLHGVSELVCLRMPEGVAIFDMGWGTGKYLRTLKHKKLIILAMDSPEN